MYAFIVKELWEKYCGDINGFLSTVGTPCVLTRNDGFSSFNSVDGFFVEIPVRASVKFDASLANPINTVGALLGALKV